jgi:hypothetical protein
MDVHAADWLAMQTGARHRIASLIGPAHCIKESDPLIESLRPIDAPRVKTRNKGSDSFVIVFAPSGERRSRRVPFSAPSAVLRVLRVKPKQ